jgi:hypothetical protein
MKFEDVRVGMVVKRNKDCPASSNEVATILRIIDGVSMFIVQTPEGEKSWCCTYFEPFYASTKPPEKTDLEIACSIGDRLRKENVAWRGTNEELRRELESERQKNMRLGDELGLAEQTARSLDLTVATSLGRLETSDAELRVAKAKIKRLEDEIRRLKWSRG